MLERDHRERRGKVFLFGKRSSATTGERDSEMEEIVRDDMREELGLGRDHCE